MPKRKEPELKPEDQFERFVQTAREHELDESGEDLERAFGKANSKPPPDPLNDKKQTPQRTKR